MIKCNRCQKYLPVCRCLPLKIKAVVVAESEGSATECSRCVTPLRPGQDICHKCGTRQVELL